MQIADKLVISQLDTYTPCMHDQIANACTCSSAYLYMVLVPHMRLLCRHTTHANEAHFQLLLMRMQIDQVNFTALDLSALVSS